MKRVWRATDLQNEVWTELGAQSPDWAVLTERRDWSTQQDAFYDSGRDKVREILVRSLPTRTQVALDFGAGTGRLSFALAEFFDEVMAADVSEPMRDELVRRAAAKGFENVTSIPPQAVYLRTYDFVISLLVLQHLASRPEIRRTFGMLLAHLNTDGTFAIEIPARPRHRISYLQPRHRVYTLARRLGLPADFLRKFGLSGISMLSLPESEVVALARAAGCRITSTTWRSADRWHYGLYEGVKNAI